MESELLKGYTTQEKEAYICTIASIATADRQATPDELEYLTALAEAAGVDQQLVESNAIDSSNHSLQQHLEVLKHSDLRFALITDIITFAKSDGKYSVEEQDKVSEIGKFLGITLQQTQALGMVADKAAQQGINNQEVQEAGFLEKTGLSNILGGAGISSGMFKGLLGMAAPLIISRILNGRNSRSGRNFNQGSGGLLGSVLGGGGAFGSILGNLSGGRGYGGIGGVLGQLLQRK